jgi:chromosomal replication initiator protein
MSVEPSRSANGYWFWPEIQRADSWAILDTVAAKHGLTREQIRTPTRRHRMSHPRQEAMWEIKQRTTLSLGQIARVVNVRDHTTVLHGIRQHEKRRAEK